MSDLMSGLKQRRASLERQLHRVERQIEKLECADNLARTALLNGTRLQRRVWSIGWDTPDINYYFVDGVEIDPDSPMAEGIRNLFKCPDIESVDLPDDENGRSVSEYRVRGDAR